MEQTAAHSFSPGARTFAVGYESEDRTWENPWFRGQGTLQIDLLGGEITLTGRRRSWWVRQRPLVLRSMDLLNVRVRGRVVQFWALTGGAGTKSRLCYFSLETEEEAQVVAQLLPATVDDDYDQEERFSAVFHRLPVASQPWRSPTVVLTAVNVLVFVVLATFFGTGWIKADVTPYMRLGASNAAATTDGEWWRLLTALFLHFGILHLGLNLWALLNIGHVLERLLGRLPFMLVYLGAGLGGGWTSLAWNGDRVWSAGASGAIFGLYGALMGAMLRARGAVPRRVFSPVVSSTLWFVGYNVAFGLANRGIDNAAHVGGLLSGFVLGWLVMRPLDLEVRRRQAARAVTFGVAAILAMAVAGVAAAPRYAYRVQEEIAWRKVLDPFIAAEQAQLQEQNRRREQVAKQGSSPIDYAMWLQGAHAPFYADWSAAIGGLAYTPGYRTERRQAALLVYLSERRAAVQEMAAAIQANSLERLRAAELAERQAVQKLASFTP
ncbi:MAG: rhomboid family intramembrane serine protease [Opitutaceae bacterium]|nr:rhomboid family intramembrane serine protease [Opitutaceae bacterium]